MFFFLLYPAYLAEKRGEKIRVIFLVYCCGAIIFQLSQILKGPLDPVTGDKIKGANKGQSFLEFFQRMISLNVVFTACGQQVPGFLTSQVVLSVKDVSVLTFFMQ